MKIGANSQMIKEISGGPVSANEVDIIELSMKHSNVLNEGIDYNRLDEIRSLDTGFSVHAPYTKKGDMNVDPGTRNENNFKIMEKVFETASILDAEYVVIHGDKVNGDSGKSFLNHICNLRHLSERAEEHSITLLLENLHNENGFERMGILPRELLHVLKSVNKENLKIVFDAGHGNLAAARHNFNILEFFDYLAPHIHHIHIHDNHGIPLSADAGYGDQHLPLGQGLIDLNMIFKGVRKTKTRNLVLELKNSCREDALKSIKILKHFNDG